MQSTQYVTLDLNTRSVFSYIRGKQGDSGSRFVCVTLTENGAAYQLPDGVEANFRCLKPDGNSVYNPAVINDDGTITVELTEQVLAVPGVVSADVCLCDTQGDILSTVSFEIRVDPAPVGTMVASENELLTLLDIIARSEGIVGIASIEQTTTSTEDDGNNVFTVALTDGTTADFTVKNGSKGSTGVTVPVNSFFTLSVDEDGNLWAHSSENEAVPDFEYDEDTGALYFVTEQE